MDPGPADVYPQKDGEDATARDTDLVGQTAARSAALLAGRLLRAAVQPAFSRLSARPRLSHCPRGDHQALERGQVVHRGRHQAVLRPANMMPPSRTRLATPKRSR